MITTTPCDGGRHGECPGEGLVQGTLRPPHEPKAKGRQVWVRVPCDCSCHLASTLGSPGNKEETDG